jgi:hypothetical protein
VYNVNLLLYARTDTGWKFRPVRKTPRGKFIWDALHRAHITSNGTKTGSEKENAPASTPPKSSKRAGGKFWN